MRSLLDVNVLIALLDADHAMHGSATKWFAGNAKEGWASCPITQNGCLRIMSHPGYPGTVPIARIAERLLEATSHHRHQFWPDDFSVLDPKVVDAHRIQGPKQLTDVYLLALAHRHDGRFVTFDASVHLPAIVGGQSKRLVLL